MTKTERNLIYALDAILTVRCELQLAEDLPAERLVYIDRCFREAKELRNIVVARHNNRAATSSRHTA